MKTYRFCPICKNRLIKIKEEDNHRLGCEKCGWRHYANPLPAVALFACNSKNEVLLVKRGVAPGKGKWALPSGFIEEGEMPEQSALRELKEETGLSGRIKNLIGIYKDTTKIYGDIILVGYETEITSGRLSSGSDIQKAGFFSLKRLPTIAFSSHRAIIEHGLKKLSSGNYLVEVLKSKITEARLTDTVHFYKGSMGIDANIMKAANLLPGEKVQVLNYNNGERLETYTIPEKPGSGKFVLYGPASRKGTVGDKLCILGYALISADEARKLKPKIIILDKKNRIR